MVATSENLQQIEGKMSGTDRVAVLLTGYGGVEKYEDFTEYNKRATEYIAAKFAPVPQLFIPLFARILTLKNLYNWGYKHQHFTSPQNDVFEKQRSGIERQLQKRWGDRVQVFLAYYFLEPFPTQVIPQIKQQGFNKLLIYPFLVIDSVFTSSIAVQQVNQAIHQMPADAEAWVQGIRYIPSFGTKPDYIDLMACHVSETITRDLADKFLNSEIGIVLMCYGSPQKQKGRVTGLKAGQTLFEHVEAKLINDYPLISIGWINHPTPFLKWTEPTLEQAAKNLIKLGAKAIVFKPIGWATENYETMIEVEEVIDTFSRQHAEITFVQMDCANDDPEFLKMAAEWANPHIEALLENKNFKNL